MMIREVFEGVGDHGQSGDPSQNWGNVNLTNQSLVCVAHNWWVVSVYG